MIAIKGMTMPNSCADCQMSYLSGLEVVYCHCILGVFGVSDIDWNHERHENCPLVNAVSVVHGKWIDETFKPWGLVHHPFKCNLCGDHAEFDSPYCPNCGAKMDERKEE